LQPQPVDDLLLIETAQRDPRQFRYLYDRYYKQIFLFVYRRTDDESLTADITQQVFLKALQHIGSFKYKGVPFSAWLYRIAANDVTQHFRNQQKTRTVCLEANDLNELADESNGIEIEKRELLFEAMRKLPAGDLEIIEMRFFEKRSFKEIGDILEITENNAKVKTYRILDKLKSLMTVAA
jgi:RNA polymerase sigma-70 factor, ECF subfamily